MSVPAVLAAIGLIVGLLSSGVASVAWLRATVARTTIEALRGDVKDRDSRIDFLEDEKGRNDAAKLRMGAEIERQQRQIEDIWDRATGVAELKELAIVMRDHDREADIRHKTLIGQHGDIIRLLRQIRDNIRVHRDDDAKADDDGVEWRPEN